MSIGKRYLLDTNVFISGHKTYYAPDICPAFWQALVEQHRAKRLCSIDRVRSELVGLNDDLKTWAQEKAPGTFFKKTADKEVINRFREIANWVQDEERFTSAAKAEFLSVADGWIVAYAKANGLVVVTLEVYAPEARGNVKIPNACKEFNVDYCNTFDMLRALKEKFAARKRLRG